MSIASGCSGVVIIAVMVLAIWVSVELNSQRVIGSVPNSQSLPAVLSDAAQSTTNNPPLRQQQRTSSGSVQASRVHRLVSWNVLAHEFTAYNTESRQLETSSERDRRWQQTAAILALIRPDLLLLQEATEPFLQAVNLASQYHVLHAKRPAKTATPAAVAVADGCVVAARSDRYQLIRSAEHHFTAAPPGQLVSRRLSLAALYRVINSSLPLPPPPPASQSPVEAGATYVLAVAVHLDGDPALPQLRLAQASEAISHAQSLLLPAGPPSTSVGSPAPSNAPPAVIGVGLAGDFNEPEIAAIQKQFAGHYPYPLQLITPSVPNAPTSFAAGTGAGGGYGKAIDYMFLSESFAPLSPLMIWPDMQRAGIVPVRPVPYIDPSLPSDHFPLVADVVL